MTKPTTFDAASLNTIEACNKPAEIEIKHPTTRLGTGLFISVIGRDSDVYRGRIRGLADESLRRQAMGKAASDDSLDKLEQKNLDVLVAATTGWRSEGDDGHITLAGERLEFTPANVRKLYTGILPIREQVAEAINDLGNFMTA